MVNDACDPAVRRVTCGQKMTCSVDPHTFEVLDSFAKEGCCCVFGDQSVEASYDSDKGEYTCTVPLLQVIPISSIICAAIGLQIRRGEIPIPRA